ncbi:MAG: hypothetical protein JW795_14230 [Chitinivibrionales bacterium]|nr:hypothetical protein [Chitinivibrionales bacterium]
MRTCTLIVNGIVSTATNDSSYLRTITKYPIKLAGENEMQYVFPQSY